MIMTLEVLDEAISNPGGQGKATYHVVQ